MDQLKTYKIIIIGDPTVGKTSLRKRYMGQGFKTTHQITIGADFAVKRMTINNKPYLFQIWDLSAQVAFKSIRNIYYKNTDGIMLVYDLTSDPTLDNIPNWANEFHVSSFFKKVPAILIGNKSDLISIEKYDSSKLDNIKQNLSPKFSNTVESILTSALNASNVDTAFTTMINLLINKDQIK